MKKLIGLAASLLIACVSISRAAEWKTFKSPEIGFEVAYAPDWKVNNKNINSATPWLMLRLPTKAPTGAVVSIIKFALSGVPFATVVAAEKKLTSTIDSQPVKVDGRDATLINSKETTLRKMSYLIEDGTNFWRLDFAAHPSEWEKDKPLFDKALASFKFIKK